MPLLISETLTHVRNVLRTVEGLNVPDQIPNALSVTPVAIITLDEGEFSVTFGNDDMYEVIITLLAARADIPSAANAILPLLDAVKSAFDNNKDLNTSVDWAHLHGFRAYGRHEFAGQEYFGVELMLTVQE